MITISSEGMRANYNSAIVSLAQANYAPRDKKTGKISQYLMMDMPIATDDFPAGITLKQAMSYINTDEVTPSYLRSECNILPNASNFQFPINRDDFGGNSPLSVTCQPLSRTDSFLCTAWGYSAMTYQMVGGQQNQADFTQGNNWFPITYVSQYHQNGAAADLDQGVGLLWVGAYLNLKVMKHELIPYWDCLKHAYVPTTQANNIWSPQPQILKDGYVGNSSNYYPVERNIILGGMRENTLTLNLPSNVPATIAPFNQSFYNVTNVLKAVWDSQGLLMQNSTVAK
jgi:hypothetical protein